MLLNERAGSIATPMPRIVEGNSRNLQDVEAFLRALEALGQHPDPNARELFTPGAELIIARAPGRLDVMGGIADYSGSLVLQLPIAEAVLAALEVTGDRSLRFVSLAGTQKIAASRKFEMRLEEFERAGVPIEYSEARAIFARRHEDHWAAYVAGTFLVLMREHGVHFRNGARILIVSHVPEGKGVSSSAVLEVAVMCAVLASINLKLDAREIALLCQKVENLVVGAPCGVMDQDHLGVRTKRSIARVAVPAGRCFRVRSHPFRNRDCRNRFGRPPCGHGRCLRRCPRGRFYGLSPDRGRCRLSGARVH